MAPFNTAKLHPLLQPRIVALKEAAKLLGLGELRRSSVVQGRFEKWAQYWFENGSIRLPVIDLPGDAA